MNVWSVLTFSNARKFLSTALVIALTVGICFFMPSISANERQQADRLDSFQFTTEDMNILVKNMDQQIVNDITACIGSATPNQFIDAYLQKDPSFENTITDYIEAH